MASSEIQFTRRAFPERNPLSARAERAGIVAAGPLQPFAFHVSQGGPPQAHPRLNIVARRHRFQAPAASYPSVFSVPSDLHAANPVLMPSGDTPLTRHQ